MATTEASTTEMISSSPLRNGVSSPPSFLEKQNEGVLRDVLNELDRERSQRAELEARMKLMKQELQTLRRKKGNKKTGKTASNRSMIAIQAERDGYLEIIEALTQDRPAFSTEQKLPIHVVRLLEVIPWDPRARHHLFGQETVYEWQMFGADKNWQTQVRYFPTVFKTLPIVIPQPGKTVGEAPTSSSPPRQCVLTNIEVTQILNIDKGYPLPKDGGDWVWVGGWRIEKHTDTDTDGWSYSNDLDLTLESSYYSDFRPPERGTPNMVKRRRKWTRSRAMIDYPQASAMTKAYLKLVAEKATLDVSVQKLSTQLVETKMKLTTMETDFLTLQEKTSLRIATLENELEDKNRMLEILQQQDGLDNAIISNIASKKDQVQELRSVVTAWVSNTVSKRQVSGSSEDTASTEKFEVPSDPIQDDFVALSKNERVASTPKTSNDVKQPVFESLKGKGSDFFEKIKQKGGQEFEKMKKQKGRTGLTPWVSAKNSSSKEAVIAPIAPNDEK